MILKDKVALVTGSGRGIGKSIALTLAKEGASIIVNDNNIEFAERTAEEIEKLGVQTLISRCNVAKKEEVDLLFEQIEDRFGRIDILVNNAGITRDGLLIKLSEEKWDQVMDVNLKGVFLCTQLAARMMIKQNSGRIVNISSIVGQMGNVGQVNYVATKSGVIGITKTLAKELAKYNINVNAIAPGFIRTPMTEEIPDKVKEKMINQIPLKRMGEPEEISNVVKFLVSNDSSYITGQVIACNGGWYV